MSGPDLFAAAAETHLAKRAPLAERMRPHSLDDIAGQKHLLGPKGALRALITTDKLGSIILWGPPGTGKTTLARVIAGETKRRFVSLSAVSAGVKDVRQTAAEAHDRLGQHGQGTILFLDEVHRFNKSQQDALLPSVEDGTLTLIGATTENPFFEVNAPLLSRSTLFRLEPLSADDLAGLVKRACEIEGIDIETQAADKLAQSSGGDARSMLTTFEVAGALAKARQSEQIEIADVEQAASHRATRYGKDEHYDVISAFIKSIRGSDVDAGLFWLSRMIEAGEDARFIARRLVVLASEDIGMADPRSLMIATAAASAVEFVGLPEAGLNLAQAVVHLASAPKSNACASAFWSAQAAAREHFDLPVPPHLRDSHYSGAEKLGHGAGYVYPHDNPAAAEMQTYLPDKLVGTRYFNR